MLAAFFVIFVIGISHGVTVRALADDIDRLWLPHRGVLIQMGRTDVVMRTAKWHAYAAIAGHVLCKLKRRLDMKPSNDSAVIPVAN